jgi:hypothetical protein
MALANERDKWACTRLDPSTYSYPENEDLIQPDLRGWDTVRGAWDHKFYEQKRHEAILKFRRSIPQYRCSFSFVPKTQIPEDVYQDLNRGVSIDGALFRSSWCDSELGSNTVNWGYGEVMDLLEQLATRHFRNEISGGFEVRDRNNHLVFMCLNSQGSCWH